MLTGQRRNRARYDEAGFSPNHEPVLFRQSPEGLAELAFFLREAEIAKSVELT